MRTLSALSLSAGRCVHLVAALTAVSAIAAGCSSSTPATTPGADSGGGGGGGTCGAPGGPVSSTPDAHCSQADGGKIVQPTSQASCHVDAGPPSAAGGYTPDYGPTLNNAEGDDDDCKYHVKFTSTPICESTDVTITVTATNRTDGSPLTGANPSTDVFLNDLHLAPNTRPRTKETSPGVYTIGPIQFDEAGKWTIRFHFFETCNDALPTSPHGHVAFYVNVP